MYYSQGDRSYQFENFALKDDFSPEQMPLLAEYYGIAYYNPHISNSRSIDGSLKRLGTDWLDIYFIHHFDSLTAMEETLRGLDDLQKQGKILYPAVSNWAAWQIAKALGISAKEELARFECIQPMYSLVKRQAEVEILPLALSEQIGVISYSPLAAGLLSGKYSNNKKPDQGRFLEHTGTQQRYGGASYNETAEKFIQYAAADGEKLLLG